jgi:hypothetical protein
LVELRSAWVAIAQTVDPAVRNSRVLARAAMRAIDLEPAAPPDFVAAVRMLAEAARSVRRASLAPVS